MFGSVPQFADLSKLYIHKLIAERGIDTLQRCSLNKMPLSEEDRKALIRVSELLQGAIEGEKVIDGSRLTPAAIHAGGILSDFIRLSQTRRPFDEFLTYLKELNDTVADLLAAKTPTSAKMKELQGFLETLADNAGQRIQNAKKGRIITVV